MDDPLLNSGTKQLGFDKKGGEEESSLGLGGMGQFEESQSIREIDLLALGKKGNNKGPGVGGADGDLNKDIVGISSIEEVRKLEKKKLKKEKKKLKKKREKNSSNSSDDENKNKKDE